MKIKSLILICASLLCIVGYVAVAQSNWNPCGHSDLQSPNAHSNVYATHNTNIITSNSQLSQVGSYRVEPMASTTYDQTGPQITNRRNTGDDPFGGGKLPDNPLEPGTPVGEVPIMLLLAFVALYAIRQKRRAQGAV